MKKQINTAKAPRKKFRRVVILFVFLVATGGTVFYFGWIQFQLDAGEYGVIYTKTHGWETQVLVNGEFAWKWEALIPTNLTLHIFKTPLQTTSIKYTGTLPSGEFYGTLAGDNVDFKWSIQARIDYRIIPETLPLLLSQEPGVIELENIYAEYESQLEGLVMHVINEGATTSDVNQLEKELKNRLETIDDRIEVIHAVILHWSYPDKELYNEAKKLALENMGVRQMVIAETEEARIRQEDIEGLKLDILSRYGEVLTAHPILLDLFSLDGNPGATLLPSLNELSTVPKRTNQ